MEIEFVLRDDNDIDIEFNYYEENSTFEIEIDGEVIGIISKEKALELAEHIKWESN